MTHKIFGYKGFVVKVFPREVIAGKANAGKRICYAAAVVIMRFTGATHRKLAMRCYPGGMCASPEQALQLGADYATQVIDDDFSGPSMAEAITS
ncbi:MAG: hypothetical protein ACRETA_08200 [Gammaproteobacteria bacterium]